MSAMTIRSSGARVAYFLQIQWLLKVDACPQTLPALAPLTKMRDPGSRMKRLWSRYWRCSLVPSNHRSQITADQTNEPQLAQNESDYAYTSLTMTVFWYFIALFPLDFSEKGSDCVISLNGFISSPRPPPHRTLSDMGLWAVQALQNIVAPGTQGDHHDQDRIKTCPQGCKAPGKNHQDQARNKDTHGYPPRHQDAYSY